MSYLWQVGLQVISFITKRKTIYVLCLALFTVLIAQDNISLQALCPRDSSPSANLSSHSLHQAASAAAMFRQAEMFEYSLIQQLLHTYIFLSLSHALKLPPDIPAVQQCNPPIENHHRHGYYRLAKSCIERL